MGFSSLIQWIQQALSPSPSSSSRPTAVWGCKERMTLCKPERKPFSRTQPCWHLGLEIPDSGTARNKGLLFSHPARGILLRWSHWDTSWISLPGRRPRNIVDKDAVFLFKSLFYPLGSSMALGFQLNFQQLHPGYIFRRIKSRDFQKYLYTHVYSSSIICIV